MMERGLFFCFFSDKKQYEAKGMVIKMIQKPKGTADIFLQEAEIWQYVEETARILLHD